MNPMRRALLLLVALIAGPVFAQGDYPTKPIKLIVPFAPGGSSDATARVVAERLGQILGQSVVIENKPGGSATIGAAVAAKSPPDGYTLFLMPGAHVLAPKLGIKTPYDTFNDFTPIANLVFAPYVIVASLPSGYTTIGAAVKAAKESPGKVAIGNSDPVTRLAAESFSKAAGVQMTHVAYKGGGPVVTDVLGGHIALGVATPTAVSTHATDKKLYALAVTSPQRMTALPDVPTLGEALNMPGFESQTWYGLSGPAKLPKPIVDKLSAAAAQIMKEKDVRDRILAIGLVPATDYTPQGLATLMKTFADQNAPLIEAANIKME